MTNEIIQIHDDYCKGLSQENISDILLQIETIISSACSRTINSTISGNKVA